MDQAVLMVSVVVRAERQIFVLRIRRRRRLTFGRGLSYRQRWIIHVAGVEAVAGTG